MNTVEPIRDTELIKAVKNELAKKGTRDLLLFTFGINSGLRISDILPLKVADVRNRDSISIREEKTDKVKTFPLNDAIKEVLIPYIAGMPDDAFLFQSRQGHSHITRQQAYEVINDACKKIGIKEKVGTHTLRKTFGYHHYKRFKDVAILQQIFNHSAPSVTLRYIGINQDMLNNSYMAMNL